MAILNAGIWEKFNGIKFYNGNNVMKNARLNKDNIILCDDLQDFARKNGFTNAGIGRVHGIVFDDNFKIRNARALKLEKNDIFSLKEYNKSTRENERILYVPTKLENLGTMKSMESDKGYWLYDKTLIDHPISISIEVWKEVTKEQADLYCDEWKGTRHDTKSIHFIKNDRYIFMDSIKTTFPRFILLTYKETVKSDYCKQLESMVEIIREKAGVHIDQYSLEKILKIYDITEKKQEA